LEERPEQVTEVFERLAREDAPEGDPDLRWRALAGLAFFRARQGDEAEARRLAAEADRVLGGLEARVPPEHRDAFAERNPARAALRRYLRREASSGAMLERVFRLMAVHRAVVAERDPRRILALALDTAIDLCGAERGFLLMLGTKGAMHVEVARNVDHEAIRSARLKVSRSIAEEVGRTGTPILTLNAQEDERFGRFESVRDLKLRSVMCVPIRGRDAILGTMYLDNRFQPGRFGEPDLRLLLAFADVVAVALENARLAQENARHAAELERAKSELEAATREQARRLETALRELEATREALGLRYDYSRIIGRSPGMLRVLQTLDRVIETHVPVLIRGESGTGKELVARALHFNGPRRDRPFVTVNCAAIPEALMESELFGHVRGAFTGALRDRDGLFAAAHGGTLFLDEIGDMSPAMQVKLLRALQEGEVRPVGSSVDRKVDVRIVAASHHDLARLVADGRFREDLFYRLNVVSIPVPPLRERKEDILLLAEHLLERFAGELGGVRKKLRPDALQRLLTHPWPGNVRELENVLKNAAVLARSDEIGPEDIPLDPGGASDAPASPSSLRLEEVEMQTIRKALRATGGNKKLAAELLGISRLTLYRKLKEE
ncbi:MAG: sigma-54-dependent Fis family transcriptional regulator, partial [Deltaproteobacteria bacterium]|nr:sigma-54-dependent Fis family transcriptional regulator [Deltaproteobacteria bacterium]